ncbi:hypothetical protein ACFYNO_02210 [Kitasatospora sp. NPDC006697]|uniref:hypothetical protein n=1 Tax=Kitasatospora sp. NPDC006697 TaxID=3364020 RepID=UPI0036B8789F
MLIGGPEMIKRPNATHRLRRGTQDLLERRGMMSAPDDRPRPVGPFLHTQPPAAAKGTGGYAALAGTGPFGRAGRSGEERAHTGDRPAHAELKGHRHRGAEHHSAH